MFVWWLIQQAKVLDVFMFVRLEGDFSKKANVGYCYEGCSLSQSDSLKDTPGVINDTK